MLIAPTSVVEPAVLDALRAAPGIVNVVALQLTWGARCRAGLWRQARSVCTNPEPPAEIGLRGGAVGSVPAGEPARQRPEVPSMHKDLVIEVDNEPGALARVAAAVSDAGVNLAAATCLGNGERAQMHILVPHPEATKHALALSNLAVTREHDVVVVDVTTSPASSPTSPARSPGPASIARLRLRRDEQPCRVRRPGHGRPRGRAGRRRRN